MNNRVLNALPSVAILLISTLLCVTSASAQDCPGGSYEFVGYGFGDSYGEAVSQAVSHALEYAEGNGKPPEASNIISVELLDVFVVENDDGTYDAIAFLEVCYDTWLVYFDTPWRGVGR